jgi:hypothetical protein
MLLRTYLVSTLDHSWYIDRVREQEQNVIENFMSGDLLQQNQGSQQLNAAACCLIGSRVPCPGGDPPRLVLRLSSHSSRVYASSRRTFVPNCHSSTMATSNQAQIQRAIAQMTERPAVPEIDFTQHTLEDGAVVSTQERVIKDVR